MPQAVLVKDYEPAFREAEQARVESLRNLIVLLGQAEKADVDRQEFSRLFRLSTHVLELDQETVAQSFRISRPTISRWESGRSAPHPLGRGPVFQLLKKLAKSRLRQHLDTPAVL